MEREILIIFLALGNNKSGKHNTVQARMLDVEFLIDELNRKMTTGSGANNSQ